MQNDYLTAVSSVLKLKSPPNSSRKAPAFYRTCYLMLFQYLMDNDIPFSIENALNWLTKLDIGEDSYRSYRQALYQLEHFTLFGDIDTKRKTFTENFFFFRSDMSESFFQLTYELDEAFAIERNPGYFQTYVTAIKTFFQHATSLGITEPEAISIDVLVSYWNNCCVSMTLERRRNAVCAMTALMEYLHRRGDVPGCYQHALFNEGIDKLEAMRVSCPGDAFHPSAILEPKMEEYIRVLDDWQYKESSINVYYNEFNWYFLFLEINHLEHGSNTIALWESVLPDYPNQKRKNCSVSAGRKHTIRLFDNYLHGTMETNIPQERENTMNTLPAWSKKIMEGFLESRKLDGMAKTTIVMCRSASSRFFHYLEERDINRPELVTAEVIKDFQKQDYHSTPESKNAYNIKLRQLLQYMAEMKLVPSTIVYSVSTSCAPRRTIVDVLSDEMIEKIYEFRATASTPLELRDIAIVMLGLRMGIRGVDIINLKIDDFNWKQQTVTFIQQKTRRAITLPVPTEVGNSVYKYICQGRPASAEAGTGYIFIRHAAPFVPLNATIACKYALKRVLSKYGIELSPGQGFHMTRKTYATRMLRANTPLDDIANALGHATKKTSEVYLERDEDKMRLCPIGFGGVFS